MHGHYNDYGCEMCCSFLLRHPPLPEIPFGPSSLTTHPASPPLITLSMTSATLAWDVFQRITGHPTQIIDSSLIAITKIATSNGSKTTRCPAQPPSQRSVHPRYDTPGEARTGIVTEWRRSTPRRRVLCSAFSPTPIRLGPEKRERTWTYTVCPTTERPSPPLGPQAIRVRGDR